MDFQKKIANAGLLAQDVGKELIAAAEREDMEILDDLRHQLQGIATFLSAISFIDRMMKGQ